MRPCLSSLLACQGPEAMSEVRAGLVCFSLPDEGILPGLLAFEHDRLS